MRMETEHAGHHTIGTPAATECQMHVLIHIRRTPSN